MDGQTIKVRAWDTIYYPLEMAFEILEGPFGGSKFFDSYTKRPEDICKCGEILELV